MADYIDRKTAIAALRGFAEKCKGSTEAATAAAMAISVILRLPGPWVSVEDSRPVLHKWILLRDWAIFSGSWWPAAVRGAGGAPNGAML